MTNVRTRPVADSRLCEGRPELIRGAASLGGSQGTACGPPNRLREDPAVWGIYLVDLAKQIAIAFEEEVGLDAAQTLRRIICEQVIRSPASQAALARLLFQSLAHFVAKPVELAPQRPDLGAQARHARVETVEYRDDDRPVVAHIRQFPLDVAQDALRQIARSSFFAYCLLPIRGRSKGGL